MTKEILIRTIKFKGIDNFNRAVYQIEGKNFYIGSIDTLFNLDATKEEVDNYFKDHTEELVYFGRHFGCEPEGDPLKPAKTIIL